MSFQSARSRFSSQGAHKGHKGRGHHGKGKGKGKGMVWKKTGAESAEEQVEKDLPPSQHILEKEENPKGGEKVKGKKTSKGGKGKNLDSLGKVHPEAEEIKKNVSKEEAQPSEEVKEKGHEKKVRAGKGKGRKRSKGKGKGDEHQTQEPTGSGAALDKTVEKGGHGTEDAVKSLFHPEGKAENDGAAENHEALRGSKGSNKGKGGKRRGKGKGVEDGGTEEKKDGVERVSQDSWVHVNAADVDYKEGDEDTGYYGSKGKGWRGQGGYHAHHRWGEWESGKGGRKGYGRGNAYCIDYRQVESLVFKVLSWDGRFQTRSRFPVVFLPLTPMLPTLSLLASLISPSSSSSLAGGAAIFGSSGYFTVPAFDRAALTQAFTIELWVRFGDSSRSTTSECLFSLVDSQGVNALSINGHSDHPGAIELRYGSNYVISRDEMENNYVVDLDTRKAMMDPGHTVHIALTHQPTGGGSELKLIVNGAFWGNLVSSSTYSMPTSGELIVGAMGPGHSKLKDDRSRFFSGTMDELRIWNVARTPAQISSSMSLGGSLLTDTSGLVAQYSFDTLDLASTQVSDFRGVNHGQKGGGDSNQGLVVVSSPMPLTSSTVYLGSFVSEQSVSLAGYSGASILTSPVTSTISGGNLNIGALPMDVEAGEMTVGATDGSSNSRTLLLEVRRKATPVAGSRYTVEFLGDKGLLSLRQPFPRSITVETWVELRAYTESALVGMHTSGGSNRLYLGEWGRYTLYFCPEKEAVSLDDWGVGLNPFHLSITYGYDEATGTYTVTLMKDCEVKLVVSTSEPCTLLDDSSGAILPITFGNEYDGGPRYSDNADAFMTDFRLWDYARTTTECAAQMRASLEGTEPGLHTFIPVTKEDVERNDGYLTNKGYMASAADADTACTGFRDLEWQYETTCKQADLICPDGSCRFRLAPFSVQSEPSTLYVALDSSIGNSIELEAYDPTLISPLLPFMDDSILATSDALSRSVLSVPTADCGEYKTMGGAVVATGDVLTTADLPLSFTPNGGMTCSATLEYAAVHPEQGTSLSTNLVVVVQEVGPQITEIRAANRAGVSILVARFSVGTNRPTADASNILMSSAFEIADVYWSDNGEVLVIEPLSPETIDLSTLTLGFPASIGIRDFTGSTAISDTSSGVSGTFLDPVCSTEGHILRSDNGQCSFCDPGSAPDFTGKTCDSCRPGSFSDDGKNCYPCPLGAAASFPGSTQCSPCAAGSAATEPGTIECAPCSKGFYQAQDGQPSCLPCESGSYTTETGSTQCTACPFANSGTGNVGAVSSLQCGCAPGFFFPCEGDDCIVTNVNLSEIVCIPTKGGMNSPGSLYPVADDAANPQLMSSTTAVQFAPEMWSHRPPLCEPGFSAIPSQPFYCYECRDEDAEICPGGTPGSCGLGRDSESIACGACALGFAASSQGGECTDCGSRAGALGLFLLICVLVIFAIILAYKVLNRKASARVVSSAGLVTSLGTTFTLMQSISLVNIFERAPAFIRSIAKFFGIFAFDVSFLRIPCAFGVSDNYTVVYISKMALPLMVVVFCVMAIPANRFLNRVTKGWVTIPQFFKENLHNMLGIFGTALYIPLAKAALSPLECYQHPEPELGRSVLSAPQVICGSDEAIPAQVMAVICISGYLVGVPAYFLFLIRNAARTSQDESFRLKTRFLFFKYRPERYYWQLIGMSRSFMLAASGIVFPSFPDYQATMIKVTLVFFGLLSAWGLPWRDTANNILDTGMMAMLIVLVDLASFPDSGTYMALTFAMLVLLIVCAILSQMYTKVREQFEIIGKVLSDVDMSHVLDNVDFSPEPKEDNVESAKGMGEEVFAKWPEAGGEASAVPEKAHDV